MDALSFFKMLQCWRLFCLSILHKFAKTEKKINLKMLLMPTLGAQKLWASNVCGKKQLFLINKQKSIGLWVIYSQQIFLEPLMNANSDILCSSTLIVLHNRFLKYFKIVFPVLYVCHWLSQEPKWTVYRIRAAIKKLRGWHLFNI